MIIFIKKVISIVFLIAVTINFLSASRRGDVQIIEATENIQYLSQKIAKDYFFFYYKQKDTILKRRVNENIEQLGLYILEIEKRTQKVSTKNLLEYFKYQIDEMKKLVNDKMTLKNAQKMLDQSDAFLEGAKSILHEHTYKFSEEEKMLMLSKKAQYLLERVNSYYMASQIGLRSDFKYKKMKSAIDEIDEVMKDINHYQYLMILKKRVDKFSELWSLNRSFFNRDSLSIPCILTDSIEYSQDILVELEEYHKKNL